MSSIQSEDAAQQPQTGAADTALQAAAAREWTPEQVGEWITSLGFPQYAACFTQNFVDGTKLERVDARSLPRLGINDFEHIKAVGKAIRDLYGLEYPRYDKSIADQPWDGR